MHFMFCMVLLWNSFFPPFEPQIRHDTPKAKENTILFYTASWCSYCLLMEKKIWKDPAIREYIKLKYNFIVLKEDSKKQYSIEDNGVLYSFNESNWPTQLFHCLQQYNRETLYPTLVIIDKRNQIIFKHQGYIKKRELEVVLSLLEVNP
ncbi:thioredoxin fold domain-containing protein [Myroides sp. LJL116]